MDILTEKNWFGHIGIHDMFMLVFDKMFSSTLCIVKFHIVKFSFLAFASVFYLFLFFPFSLFKFHSNYILLFVQADLLKTKNSYLLKSKNS